MSEVKKAKQSVELKNALLSGRAVLAHEVKGNSVRATWAQSLIDLAISEGQKTPFFTLDARAVVGGVRTVYETLDAEYRAKGHSNFSMVWMRMRGTAAELAAPMIAKDKEHIWAPKAPVIQAAATKVAEKRAKDAERKKAKPATPAPKALPTAPIIQSAASVQATGPVDTAPAIAAQAVVVSKLPADERLTLEVTEKLDELLALFKSAPESVSFPAFVDAGILVGKASKLLATKREQAKAHASRLKNGGAQ